MREATDAAGELHCYGLLLAAGVSRRFGADKRLHPMPETSQPARPEPPLPIGLATVQQWLCACANENDRVATLDHIFVVTRPDDNFSECLTNYLAGSDSQAQHCTILYAENAHLGMGYSLASAVKEIPPGALVIGLADMPWVQPDTLRAMASRLRAAPANAVVQPLYNGQPGNPLGFGTAHRSGLEGSTGDAGARVLVRQARVAGQLIGLDVPDPGILHDVDRPEDLAGRVRSTQREG